MSQVDNVVCLSREEEDSESDEEYIAKQKLLRNIKILTIGKRRFILSFTDAILCCSETLKKICKRDRRGDHVSGWIVFFDNPANKAIFFGNLAEKFNARRFCEFVGGKGFNGKKHDGYFLVNCAPPESAVFWFQERMNEFLQQGKD